MNRRIWSLPALMGLLLFSIYFLPESKEMAPSAIHMDLPKESKSWLFHHRAPSEEEIKILADDTDFRKAVCLSPRPGEFSPATGERIPDRIDLSVVFSGHDLNNSIHRPERCMPAQGHVIGNSSKKVIRLPNGRDLPVRRLLSVQSLPVDKEHTKYVSYPCVTYYFFVGHQSVTEDHFVRTLRDIKDRLLFGMDQRWAYASVSMWYGKLPWIENEISLEEADRKLEEFLKDFASSQIDWKQVR